MSDNVLNHRSAWLLELQSLDLAELGRVIARGLGPQTAAYVRSDTQLVLHRLIGPAGFAPTIGLPSVSPSDIELESRLPGPGRAIALRSEDGLVGALVLPAGVEIDARVQRTLARALGNALLYSRCRAEARLDSKTGLYNARWLAETLDSEVRRATRYGADLAVLMIDLDGLKPLNDTLGHLAGDLALRHVADQIRMVLRQADAAARVGGDEFVVVLPETDASGARRVARRLREALRQEPLTLDGRQIQLSASIGVSCWARGLDATELLADADCAMYAVKRLRRTARV